MSHTSHYVPHSCGPGCAALCDGWPTTPDELAAAAREEAALAIEGGDLPEGWVKLENREAWKHTTGGLVTELSMGPVPELVRELELDTGTLITGWRWVVYDEGSSDALIDSGEALLGLGAIEAAAQVKPEKELRA